MKNKDISNLLYNTPPWLSDIYKGNRVSRPTHAKTLKLAEQDFHFLFMEGMERERERDRERKKINFLVEIPLQHISLQEEINTVQK